MPSTDTTAAGGAQAHVRDLHHAFTIRGAALTALDGVTLDAAPGEFLSIVGPSGCGKSTLLRLIGGLLPTQRGEVLVDGSPPAAARRAKAIGVVFQDPSLLPWRTVSANVRLPLEVNRGAGGRWDADEALAMVGLEGFGHAYPHQLSGGMQQRVAIARALVTDPPLLLMDEPFGALDEITRAELRRELLRITARARKTVIFVTHSIAEAALLSDRVAVMTPRPGRLRAVVPVDLPGPRSDIDETDPVFVAQVRRLRDLLLAAHEPIPGGPAGGDRTPMGGR